MPFTKGQLVVEAPCICLTWGFWVPSLAAFPRQGPQSLPWSFRFVLFYECTLVQELRHFQGSGTSGGDGASNAPSPIPPDSEQQLRLNEVLQEPQYNTVTPPKPRPSQSLHTFLVFKIASHCLWHSRTEGNCWSSQPVQKASWPAQMAEVTSPLLALTVQVKWSTKYPRPPPPRAHIDSRGSKSLPSVLPDPLMPPLGNEPPSLCHHHHAVSSWCQLCVPARAQSMLPECAAELIY